jgi:uncharacterized protein (TIGR02246 family)
MKSSILIVLIAFTYILNIKIPALAENQTNVRCVNVKANDIKNLFYRWNNSLQTKNPDIVVKNYANNAVLLPTLSHKIHQNTADIREYFVDFLKNSPSGKINHRIIRIGCNSATDTGIYTFTFTNQGKQEKVPARYSFVYEYINGKWLIVSHHSSKMPE